MTPHLKGLSLLDRPLFKVKEEHVEFYNRCLQKISGRTTRHSSFEVDKRGFSPQLGAELGENYLQKDPSHRYMIIISPEQQTAPLLREEFSVDKDVIDFFYANCAPALTLATRVDGMYVELCDGLGGASNLEELLRIRKLTLEAHTPSGFLTKARKLQDLVAQLQANSELLIENDSAVVKEIQTLVNEVGDVRGCNLGGTRQTVEICSFAARAFGGMYVFRDLHNRIVKTRRPASGDGSASGQIPAENATVSETVVVYADETQMPADTDQIRFIPLASTGKILEFLASSGFIRFDRGLIEPRLRRIEDDHLLTNGHAVDGMREEERGQVLEALRTSLPPIHDTLTRLRREVLLSESSPERTIERQNEKVRALLAVTVCTGTVAHVVQSLLTRLFRLDYERMFDHNPEALEQALSLADDKRRAYITAVVKRASGQTR
jgi:hypothetical protein